MSTNASISFIHVWIVHPSVQEQTQIEWETAKRGSRADCSRERERQRQIEGERALGNGGDDVRIHAIAAFLHRIFFSSSFFSVELFLGSKLPGATVLSFVFLRFRVWTHTCWATTPHLPYRCLYPGRCFGPCDCRGGSRRDFRCCRPPREPWWVCARNPRGPRHAC